MGSSFVTCDGSTVVSNFSGIVPRSWDTSIRILVPENQICLFVPKNTKKFKNRLMRAGAPGQEQALIMKSHTPEMRMKENRVLGHLYFLSIAPTPTLQWD
jgi:hypothetical protein